MKMFLPVHFPKSYLSVSTELTVKCGNEGHGFSFPSHGITTNLLLHIWWLLNCCCCFPLGYLRVPDLDKHYPAKWTEYCSVCGVVQFPDTLLTKCVIGLSTHFCYKKACVLKHWIFFPGKSNESSADNFLERCSLGLRPISWLLY